MLSAMKGGLPTRLRNEWSPIPADEESWPRRRGLACHFGAQRKNRLVNTAQSIAGPLGRLGLHVCGGGACLPRIRSGNSCMNRPWWKAIRRRFQSGLPTRVRPSPEGYETWNTTAIIIQKDTESKMHSSPWRCWSVRWKDGRPTGGALLRSDRCVGVSAGAPGLGFLCIND